jgi:nucleotide-binding universal stress UspA family protein
MPGIVCAIRGGPASRPTIKKSIELAMETSLPLYFLYIVNLNFLTHTSSTRTHLISKEMKEMGEFILLTAQAEAQSAGITAEGVVRQGKVRDEIVEFIQEVEADIVVLGKPKIQPEDINVFTQDRLNEFSLKIERESSAKIVITEI